MSTPVPEGCNDLWLHRLDKCAEPPEGLTVPWAHFILDRHRHGLNVVCQKSYVASQFLGLTGDSEYDD